MKIPLSWLKDYVDFDHTAEELAEKLTFSGTEVEGLHTVGGSFDGLLVGEILDAQPMAGTERLRLCRVFDGSTVLNVVCGAENAVKGVKTALAPTGSTLPDGTAIGAAKVGQEISDGLLCAEDELGLSDDHAGILVLDPTVAAGSPLSAALGGAQQVLELEVTWNRSDCLSVIGMAREIAALLGRPLRRPAIAFDEKGPPIADRFAVHVEDPRLCPRYMARLLTGLVPGRSPFWMRQRLSLCGIRSIGNIVDVTNYVLIECGQPLHAFDYARLAGQRIGVRVARAGERMRTLDGEERLLPSGALVIADAEKPVALAGIMGGATSEIGPQTSEVLLESAWFDPASIHAASSRLGLITEASRRFERGVDPQGVAWAARRAAALMIEHCGATAVCGAIDCFPNGVPARSVRCRYSKVRAVTAMDVADTQMTAILEKLEIPVTVKEQDAFVAAIPSFRHDIEEEADLIEEIARIHGLDQVQTSAPVSRIVPGADDRPFRSVSACRQALVGLGLAEIMNYSFVAAALLDLFDTRDGDRRIALPNPVSADQGFMRHSLLPQMAETLGRNVSRQIEKAALFEIGRVFGRGGDGSIGDCTRLAMGLIGAPTFGWRQSRRGVADEDMFLALKGILEALNDALHGERLSFQPECAPFWQADSAAAVLVGEKRIGTIGLLSRSLRSHWRMRGPVALAEINVEPLTRNVFRIPQARPVPVRPSVARDLAVIAADSLTHAQIEKTIQECAPSFLTGIDLFDSFKSKEIGDGRKSLAYSLTYRSAEKTLTDEEVNCAHDTVKQHLRDSLEVEFRE